MVGSICLATSIYSLHYQCHYAYDGNMATEWVSRFEGNAGLITVTLPGPRYISCIVAYARCGVHTSSIHAQFDNGETEEIVSVHLKGPSTSGPN